MADGIGGSIHWGPHYAAAEKPSHQDTNMDLHSFSHPSVTKIRDRYWFHETSDEAFPGQLFGLEIKRLLHHSKSEYQDILVFESATFGNVLVLNGIVQCTEKDEFAYQEMITHVAVMNHPHPKKVLVIGGGDCGVVRELVKHVDISELDSITLVEIDQQVIDLSVQYLPEMAKFHNHPKVTIKIADGFEFLRKLGTVPEAEKYDVIITDSSDPEGPAEEFFQVNYFALLQSAAKADGVVIMQSSENIWLNLAYLTQLKDKASQVFRNVAYCQCYMPSYTSGQLGLLVACNDAAKDLTKPVRTAAHETEVFRYYSAKVHEAAFVLPAWADRAVNGQ